MRSKKIAVISLGCDKNRVDTEKMLWYLARGGDYTVTDDRSEADVIIINTCAFIESARKEAVEAILDAVQSKKSGKCSRLIVTGCLPQKYAAELKAELPEVDAFLGVNEYEKIAACVEGGGEPAEKSDGRILTTPPHYAYLRIADGCDNHCTFCTIPSIRGPYRSEPIEKLADEAKRLADEGAKELIVVAQDVTNYGKDLYGRPSLVPLLEKLKQTDVKWIRLMYCYPELMTDELIDLIASEQKIVNYVDVPMQHVSDRVLKLMNRRSTRAMLETLCEKLAGRGIALRTTFMVGFPGETEADFEELLDFTERYRPERVGIFAYSKEADTPSARLKGHLPKAEKLKRVRRLGELVKNITRERNAALVGKTLEVLYEDIDYDRGLFVGRTASDAPDVDGVVRFRGAFADVGEFYKVKITGYEDYDLLGEIEE